MQKKCTLNKVCTKMNLKSESCWCSPRQSVVVADFQGNFFSTCDRNVRFIHGRHHVTECFWGFNPPVQSCPGSLKVDCWCSGSTKVTWTLESHLTVTAKSFKWFLSRCRRSGRGRKRCCRMNLCCVMEVYNQRDVAFICQLHMFLIMGISSLNSKSWELLRLSWTCERRDQVILSRNHSLWML